jgi:hypothetical protein
MSGIQHADFGFLVGEYGVDDFYADFLPGRSLRNEMILDHPLGEGLAHHRAAVIETRGGENSHASVKSRTRRDSVDHGTRRGRMGLHPLFERSEIAAREEFGEAGAESLPVMAQIVAALQCDGPSAR